MPTRSCRPAHPQRARFAAFKIDVEPLRASGVGLRLRAALTGGSVISKHPQRSGCNSGKLAMFWANPRARRCSTCRSNPRSKENTKFARAQALRPSPRPGALGRLAAPNRGRHCANVRVSQDVSDQHGPHAGSPRRVTARRPLTSCATPVRQRFSLLDAGAISLRYVPALHMFC